MFFSLTLYRQTKGMFPLYMRILMPQKFRYFLLACLMLPSAAIADVTILVHGYLTNGVTWDKSGIVTTMEAHGWHDGGPLIAGYQTSPVVQDGNTLYVVELPFNAPLMVQSEILQQQLLKAQRRHPDEKFTLVGHSAGGVVARMTLVRYGAQQVTHLITIASPHLGTPLALDGLKVTRNSGPFNIVKRVVGGDAYAAATHSRALFADLRPARPGTELFRLNNQPHPDISYTSVIRADRDSIVPSASQDMNLVPALEGKSAIYLTPGSHYLKSFDGRVVLSLLEQQ